MAAMTRTSTVMSCEPPTRLNAFSSRKRSSLACSAGTISPISSRKTVPPSACSNSPRFCWRASVKAPRSWPNSSLSSSVSGIAEQVMFTNGRLARSLLKCSTLAARSLPVPLSPVSSTVDAGLAATLRSSSRSSAITARLADDAIEGVGLRLAGAQHAALRGAAASSRAPWRPSARCRRG